jgi:hypothetical protein
LVVISHSLSLFICTNKIFMIEIFWAYLLNPTTTLLNDTKLIKKHPISMSHRKKRQVRSICQFSNFCRYNAKFTSLPRAILLSRFCLVLRQAYKSELIIFFTLAALFVLYIIKMWSINDYYLPKRALLLKLLKERN